MTVQANILSYSTETVLKYIRDIVQ